MKRGGTPGRRGRLKGSTIRSKKDVFGFTTQWGLLGRLESAFDRPDICLDDKDTIVAKFGGYKDLKIVPNDELLTQLKRK